MERLFNILKAYSLYDPAVGYVQGLAFVAGPLLLNMPDEEAFSCLVSLMKDYDLRSLYLPDMPGLHIRLYQFDRLLEDHLPAVHIHLGRVGVTSSMYASQWFLTMFAYKFPMPLVVRIFDVLIVEGLDAILKFGIALMRKNAEIIMTKTTLESLLDYLKEGLFLSYQDTPLKSPGLFTLTPDPTYRVQEFVADAYDVTLDKDNLAKYEKEFQEASELQKTRDEEHESLRQTNISLTAKVRHLEESVATVNREHIEVANFLVTGKLELARVEDENEELKTQVIGLKAMLDKQPQEVEDRLRTEMDGLLARVVETGKKNQILEDLVANMEQELIQTKMIYATEHEDYESLQRKWNDLKKSLD